MALGLGGLVMAVLASAYLSSMRSFTSFSNSIALESQSRLASDRLSEEIRQGDRILQSQSDGITVVYGTNQVSFLFDPTKRLFTRTGGGSTQVLLEDCDSISYEFFSRAATNASYGLLPGATATNANAVQISWRCSRNLLGRAVNVVERSTPRIVLRRTLL